MIEINVGDRFVSTVDGSEWFVSAHRYDGNLWTLRKESGDWTWTTEARAREIQDWVSRGVMTHHPRSEPKPSSQTLCTCTHSFLVAGCTCGAFEAERV